VRVNIFRQHRQTIQVRSSLSLSLHIPHLLSSTSNPRMRTFSDKRNWSSSMKQQPYLYLWSATSWAPTSSSWPPQSTATKAPVVRFHSN
jgi:hypothetical protein